MGHEIQILLQCTIPHAEDDWHVGRFSLLQRELARVATVTARNREPDERGDDPVLTSLGTSRFDELWLMGVDGGAGLSAREIEGVAAFNRAGRGLLTARDHENMGLWLRQLPRVGQAHFFNRREFAEPESTRLAADDLDTPQISWPNYHSGPNGGLQRLEPVEPVHPLLLSDDLPHGRVELFPSHPHEGAVRPPSGLPSARAIARGHSQTTGRTFDLIVAFEHEEGGAGRAIAESSFHHFADYNWDVARGAPSFVTEVPGDGIQRDPHALDHVRAYVRNAAKWLGP